MLCGLSTYDIMQNDTYSKLVDAINQSAQKLNSRMGNNSMISNHLEIENI